jgi:RES domain-containing protein
MRMTPLPDPLGRGAALVAWRVDNHLHASTWDGGIGAERGGGRWNPKGIKAVYCSFDPSTTILEVAVHKGFDVLDTIAHTLTSMTVADPAEVKIVWPADVPNPGWLHAGVPSAGQQAWGAALLSAHPFVAFPSAVSKPSWNLVFRADIAAGKYVLREQVPLVIDGRLNPAKP